MTELSGFHCPCPPGKNRSRLSGTAPGIFPNPGNSEQFISLCFFHVISLSMINSYYFCKQKKFRTASLFTSNLKLRRGGARRPTFTFIAQASKFGHTFKEVRKKEKLRAVARLRNLMRKETMLLVLVGGVMLILLT